MKNNINTNINTDTNNKVIPFKVPRMRTINKAYEEIKKLDSGTDIKPSTIRRMVNNNEIPHKTVGNRILINLDTLIQKLYTTDDMCVL